MRLGDRVHDRARETDDRLAARVRAERVIDRLKQLGQRLAIARDVLIEQVNQPRTVVVRAIADAEPAVLPAHDSTGFGSVAGIGRVGAPFAALPLPTVPRIAEFATRVASSSTASFKSS